MAPRLSASNKYTAPPALLELLRRISTTNWFLRYFRPDPEPFLNLRITSILSKDPVNDPVIVRAQRLFGCSKVSGEAMV